MIVVENLSKHFGGIRAVNNVSLSIASGSITGLIGPNGAGKSTALYCIMGLIACDSGEIRLNNNDITTRYTLSLHG